MNYLCFYSFIFGVETKVLIGIIFLLSVELKDIMHMTREKSKRGVTNDAILVVTKTNQEHFFSNLFRRDETFELLEYLITTAMQKLLKSTAIEPAPGSALGTSHPDLPSFGADDDVSSTPCSIEPLIERLGRKKKNFSFASSFNLPISENLLDELGCTVSVSGTQTSHQGIGYLSDSFFCFASTMAHQCQVIVPFFTVKRVEKSVY
jgi:hypothetical protein